MTVPQHSLRSIFIRVPTMLSALPCFQHVLRAGETAVNETARALGLREVRSPAEVTRHLTPRSRDVPLRGLSSHTTHRKWSAWGLRVPSPHPFPPADAGRLWGPRDKSEPAGGAGGGPRFSCPAGGGVPGFRLCKCRKVHSGFHRFHLSEEGPLRI